MWKELAAATTKPIIIVLIHGGSIDISDMVASARVGAVLTAWYPAQGVMGIPDVLLGTTPPSGGCMGEGWVGRWVGGRGWVGVLLVHATRLLPVAFGARHPACPPADPLRRPGCVRMAPGIESPSLCVPSGLCPPAGRLTTCSPPAVHLPTCSPPAVHLPTCSPPPAGRGPAPAHHLPTTCPPAHHRLQGGCPPPGTRSRTPPSP